MYVYISKLFLILPHVPQMNMLPGRFRQVCVKNYNSQRIHGEQNVYLHLCITRG